MMNFRLSELLCVLTAILFVGQIASVLAGDGPDIATALSIPDPDTLAVMLTALIGFGLVVAGQRQTAPIRRRRVNRARLRARRAAA